MKNQDALLRAIYRGNLVSVRQLLEAGTPVEFEDGEGVPGAMLGLACSIGEVAIVRELVKYGAQVNLADNSLPTSPLSIALSAGKVEVVRALIELGVLIPPGMVTGLSEPELVLAELKALRDGFATSKNLSKDVHEDFDAVEIDIQGRSGVDTVVLEAELEAISRNAP
jgi:ankyrin repeat protein